MSDYRNIYKYANPAIFYKITMDLISDEVDKGDKDAMNAWDYLWNKCREECTHKHIDSSSSWTYPFENIDYKICDYCSWH